MSMLLLIDVVLLVVVVVVVVMRLLRMRTKDKLDLGKKEIDKSREIKNNKGLHLKKKNV